MPIRSSELVDEIRAASAGDPLPTVLGVLVEALGADHGAVLTQSSAVALRHPPSDIEFAFSRRVVDSVLDSGEAMVTADLIDGDEQRMASQSIVAQGIRSVMCVPFRHRDEEALLYMDSVTNTLGPKQLRVVQEVLAEVF